MSWQKKCPALLPSINRQTLRFGLEMVWACLPLTEAGLCSLWLSVLQRPGSAGVALRDLCRRDPEKRVVGLFHVSLSRACAWACVGGMHETRCLHPSIVLHTYEVYARQHDAIKHQEGRMISSASHESNVLLLLLLL
jgi:hypothetical protein